MSRRIQQWNCILGFFCLLIFTAQVFAATDSSTSSNKFKEFWSYLDDNISYYADLQLSHEMGTFGKAQDVDLFRWGTMLEPTTFSAGSETIAPLGWQIGGGIKLPINPHWSYQLGLDYYQMAQHTVNGQIFMVDFQPPNFDYNYTVNASALFLEGQINYLIKDNFSAFGRLGLGYGSAKISSMNITQVGGVTDPFNVSGNSASGLAYNIGIGGAYSLAKIPLSFNIGYGLYHLANAINFGEATNQNGGGHVQTNAIAPSEIWVGMEYDFGGHHAH